MATLGTWWRTLRRLKRQQVIGRLTSRLRSSSVDLRPAPRRRAATGRWQLPARRQATLIGPTTFKFLEVARDIGATGWSAPDAQKLWQYNLNYFDDLNAFDAPQRSHDHRALIARWIECNPPATVPAWDPYPVSLRLVNWIKWLLAGNQPEPQWLDSLAVQTRWLRRRLELHLLGNHLFVNAKALVFAGLFFEGPEADDWLRTGAALLERETAEQVLPDGGHFERSPMYHALALEDLLDLVNVIGTFAGETGSLTGLRAALADKVPSMVSWLRGMVHPSLELASFNDCADGIAPDSRELEGYAGRLGIPLRANPGEGVVHFKDSGYVRVTRSPIVAILDVAAIGPDYLPAHAHADTLSFELSLGSTRVLVNGGTSLYEVGDRRGYERRTQAHNTVEVADQDSSEVWGSFRVGRRATPRDLTLEGWSISCSHDGYRHLKGKPMHRRSWTFGERGVLVDDRVSGSASARARFFLAPDLRFRDQGAGRWRVAVGERGHLEVAVEVGRALVARARQAQRFGKIEEVDCLTVDLVEGTARTAWSWA